MLVYVSLSFQRSFTDGDMEFPVNNCKESSRLFHIARESGPSRGKREQKGKGEEEQTFDHTASRGSKHLRKNNINDPCRDNRLLHLLHRLWLGSDHFLSFGMIREENNRTQKQDRTVNRVQPKERPIRMSSPSCRLGTTRSLRPDVNVDKNYLLG